MNQGRYIFSQMTDFLPKRYFERLVENACDRTKGWALTFWSHLLVLIYAQLDGCRSLREMADIACAHAAKSYHLGFGPKAPDKSMLSRANNLRDWRVFQDFAFYMMKQAERGGIPREFTLRGKFYAFDSTTIDLCMSLFDWAKFRSEKAGIKVHTMFDIVMQIPVFFRITNANVHDVNAMDEIPYERGAFYIFDKGYYDLDRLYRMQLLGSFFVIREKGTPRFEFDIEEDPSFDTGNVIADQVIRFATTRNLNNYPAKLRRIIYYSPELGRTFTYYTNNFYLSAEAIALLYKNRWQVETFFKWLKQHLRVTVLWGYNENAVRIQICAAIITFCLVHLIRHDLKTTRSTYEVMRILGSSLLAKDTIRDLFYPPADKPGSGNDLQLRLDFAC